MRWGVHTMLDMGMIGRNFLAWHRQYVVQLERRLERLRPNVTIPYWDWTRDREIPEALTPTRLRGVPESGWGPSSGEPRSSGP
jgi:hypothetical protein